MRSFISDSESLFKERVNNFPKKQNQSYEKRCDKRDRHGTRLIGFAFSPDELKCTDARDLKFTFNRRGSSGDSSLKADRRLEGENLHKAV